MKAYTYLILYSYVNTCKEIEKNDSVFYYSDKKISDCSLEEAESVTKLIVSTAQKKVRKKLCLAENATVHVVIFDIKLIE